MKKLIAFCLVTSLAFASDAITIDSLFKKSLGLRSTTTFSFLTSGNALSYTTYPNISQNADPIVYNDTKELIVSESLLYALSANLDLLLSFDGKFSRKEYTDINTYEFKHKNKSSFGSCWLGFDYSFASIADFKPSITFQSALLQNERASDEQKKFYLHSHSLKISFKSYLDPVVYSLFVGYGYNKKRHFDFATITYGSLYFMGSDFSIVLNPKLSLDLGFTQSFQEKQKINNFTASNLRSIATYSLGSTYSINTTTAFSVSLKQGGTSLSPDSILSMSLWKKF